MDIQTRSGGRINIDALRLMPYATLVRAITSCFMLISIGTAFLGAGAESKSANDIFISFSLLSILAVIGYALAIYCLCRLLDLSARFRTVLILLVVAVIASCMEVLVHSGEIYQRAFGHQNAVRAMNLANNMLYAVEVIAYAAALCILMKGLAGVLNAKEDNRSFARQLDILGVTYVSALVVLHVAVNLAYAKESGSATHLLAASLFILTLLEIVLFFAQRRAAVLIWMDLSSGSRAGQATVMKGRG